MPSSFDSTIEPLYDTDEIQTLQLTEAISEEELSLTQDGTMDNQLSAGGNPFLPSHILKQLKQDNAGLIEEIAQSGDALNASTALIRAHTRAKPSNFTPRETNTRDERKVSRYKTIDDLVEKYLPVIEADLRRKLRDVVDEEIA